MNAPTQSKPQQMYDFIHKTSSLKYLEVITDEHLN